MRLGWLSVGLLLLTGAAQPAPLTGADVWRRPPDPERMSDHYPVEAAQAGLGGRAVVRCAVGQYGNPEGCTVLKEEPAGHGFGEATVRALGRASFRTTDAQGQSTVGRSYTASIVWQPPPPKSEAAREVLRCEAQHLAFGMRYESLAGRPLQHEKKAVVKRLTREYTPVPFADAKDVEARLEAAIRNEPEADEAQERMCKRRYLDAKPRLDMFFGCVALKTAVHARTVGAGSAPDRLRRSQAARDLVRHRTSGMPDQALARAYLDARVKLLLGLPELPDVLWACTMVDPGYFPNPPAPAPPAP